MKIDGINPGKEAAQAFKNTKNRQNSHLEAESPVAVENTQSEEKSKGLIPLLQAGHFKGIADVRLRINFHDEIQNLEVQTFKSTALESFEEFNHSVQQQIAILRDSEMLDERQTAALDTFLQEIANTQSGMLDGQNGSTQSLIETLQIDFASLMTLLTPSISDPAQQPEPSTEFSKIEEDLLNEIETALESAEPQPMTEPIEEASQVQQIIQDFEKNFQISIEKLQSDLAKSHALPPISVPSGNGKAYAKFISIYENMLLSDVPDES